jgi:hypothetical protein
MEENKMKNEWMEIEVGTHKGCPYILMVLLFTHMAFSQTIVAVLDFKTAAQDSLVQEADLNFLTDELRRVAASELPARDFTILTKENVYALIPQGKTLEECEGSCLVDTGRKLGAGFITQGTLGRVGENYHILVELYATRSGNLVSSFTANAPELSSLPRTISANAPALFQKIRAPQNSLKVPSGISGVSVGEAKLVSVPQNFADKTSQEYIGEISVSTGASSDPQFPYWNMEISGLPRMLGTNRFAAPGRHTIALSHRCYQDIWVQAELKDSVSGSSESYTVEAVPKKDLPSGCLEQKFYSKNNTSLLNETESKAPDKEWSDGILFGGMVGLGGLMIDADEFNGANFFGGLTLNYGRRFGGMVDALFSYRLFKTDQFAYEGQFDFLAGFRFDVFYLGGGVHVPAYTKVDASDWSHEEASRLGNRTSNFYGVFGFRSYIGHTGLDLQITLERAQNYLPRDQRELLIQFNFAVLFGV